MKYLVLTVFIARLLKNLNLKDLVDSNLDLTIQQGIKMRF